MVISWLHANVSDNIKKSILFISSACEIPKELEDRFQLSNGSRKYKLSKELFDLTQNKISINDYFTMLSSLWEELESMNILPTITTITPEITALLVAIDTQREESKLFVFLKGLDEVYSPTRSKLLMQNPLPTVKVDKKSQREVLPNTKVEFSVMFRKKKFGSKGACVPCLWWKRPFEEKCGQLWDISHGI